MGSQFTQCTFLTTRKCEAEQHTCSRQIIKVMCWSQLHGLQGEFCWSSTDDDSQVVRRTSSST